MFMEVLPKNNDRGACGQFFRLPSLDFAATLVSKIKSRFMLDLFTGTPHSLNGSLL